MFLQFSWWQEVLEAAGKFDEQYKVREKAMYAAAAWQNQTFNAASTC